MMSPIGFMGGKVSAHCHVPYWRQRNVKLHVYIWISKDKVLQEEEEVLLVFLAM